MGLFGVGWCALVAWVCLADCVCCSWRLCFVVVVVGLVNVLVVPGDSWCLFGAFWCLIQSDCCALLVGCCYCCGLGWLFKMSFVLIVLI